MSFEESNGKIIDEYITNNPQATLPKTHSVLLEGQNVDLQVYKIPLKNLVYNIKNGRFAAEYQELKNKKGRELESENKEDRKELQNLLISLDPKQSMTLEKNVRQYGQREPGVCTHGGQVINGNRRMSIIENIFESDSNFKDLMVARLPPNISPIDLWKIEAGIQLSRNVQLDYGPINTLLKFKQGIDAGLTALQITKTLYGDYTEKEVLEKLEVLELIVRYLDYIGERNNFKKVEGITEHFTDFRKKLDELKKTYPNPSDITKIKRIAFQLIHDGIDVRTLRKLKDILIDEQLKANIFRESEKYCQPEKAGEKLAKKLNAEENDAYTPARTIFINSLDSLKAKSEAGEPIKLINRAIKNLEIIDPKHSSLKNSDSKERLDLLYSIIDKIMKN
ncbi:hypothetical protein OAJ83_03570 [Candidatus Nitrosopelagicus sp.]|nr:hypothetical protein [Candidatus Nitrosopelagicus sp.]